MGPEAKLRGQVTRYLKKLEPDLFWWSQVAHPKMRRGLPDITVIYGGKYYGLELKAGNNQPTLHQETTMSRIRKAGGVAVVIRSVREVKELFPL